LQTIDRIGGNLAASEANSSSHILAAVHQTPSGLAPGRLLLVVAFGEIENSSL
jgi:hypothetical protein